MDKELFQDLWKDARMWEVIRYLEGGCALQVPPDWAAVMTPLTPQGRVHSKRH